MRALSIRQPYAELILRGIKTVEYRSRRTSIIGERFLIYASKGRSQKAGAGSRFWSKDLADTGEAPVPRWMIELAEQVGMIEEDALLPRGVIVGSAEIARCELLVARGNGQPAASDEPQATIYEWHLTNVERAKTLHKPKGHPQPVWFKAF